MFEFYRLLPVYLCFKLYLRTLHEEVSNCQTKENLKSGHGPERWARHQDELAD
jgi:hypothetical protein